MTGERISLPKNKQQKTHRRASVTLDVREPKYTKQFKTQNERQQAFLDVQKADFAANELLKLQNRLLDSVVGQRTKLRKEGFLV